MKRIILAIVFVTVTVLNADGFWQGVGLWLALCFGWCLLEALAVELWDIIRADTDMDKQVRAARRYRSES